MDITLKQATQLVMKAIASLITSGVRTFIIHNGSFSPHAEEMLIGLADNIERLGLTMIGDEGFGWRQTPVASGGIFILISPTVNNDTLITLREITEDDRVPGGCRYILVISTHFADEPCIRHYLGYASVFTTKAMLNGTFTPTEVTLPINIRLTNIEVWRVAELKGLNDDAR